MSSSADKKNFGSSLSPLESRGIVIGAIIVALLYFFRGDDLTLNKAFLYFTSGYIFLTLVVFIRAYCRKKSDRKNSLTQKLMDA